MAGVRLSVDGEYKGELPLKLEMSRSFVGGRQFMAKFEKEGYATQQFQLNREFNTVAILDISSVLTSGGVDVFTGSLMKFSPVEYHVQMLEAHADARMAARSAELYRFALFNFRRLQGDIARGGGEHLRNFAAMLAGADSARMEEFSHRNALALVTAPTAPEINQMIAESPLLSRYRF